MKLNEYKSFLESIDSEKLEEITEATNIKSESDLRKAADTIAKKMSKDGVKVIVKEVKYDELRTGDKIVSATWAITYNIKSSYIDTTRYDKFEGYIYLTSKFYEDFKKIVKDRLNGDLSTNNDGSIVWFTDYTKN